MRTLFAAFVLFAAGCECGRPVSVGFDDDAGGEPGLPDSGDRFSVRDGGTLAPACPSVERAEVELPDIGDGPFGRRMDVGVDGDRILLVDRVDDVDGATFHFYLGGLESPFVRIAEWRSTDVVGFAQAVRFRDGAWDVLVDVASPWMFAWLRVQDDGHVDAIDVPLVADRPWFLLEVQPLDERFVALLREEDTLTHPLRVLELSPDGSHGALDIEDSPGADDRFQLLARGSRGEALVVAHDTYLGRQPRILRFAGSPLRPAGGWVETSDFELFDYVHYRLHDTPSGLVSTTFRTRSEGGAHRPRVLEVRWLDEAYRTTAEWSVETVVLGDVAIAGALPAQEIVVTLPDSDDEGMHGTATVFHARASAPGTVSALMPIGRSRAAFPPSIHQREDGRFEVLSYDTRIEVSTLCEAP